MEMNYFETTLPVDLKTYKQLSLHQVLQRIQQESAGQVVLSEAETRKGVEIWFGGMMSRSDDDAVRDALQDASDAILASIKVKIDNDHGSDTVYFKPPALMKKLVTA